MKTKFFTISLLFAAFLVACNKPLDIGNDGNTDTDVNTGDENHGGSDPKAGDLSLSLDYTISSDWEDGHSAGDVTFSMLKGDQKKDCSVVCKVDGQAFVDETVSFASHIGGVSRKMPPLAEGRHVLSLTAMQGGTSCTCEKSFELEKVKRPVTSVTVTVKDEGNGRNFTSVAKEGEDLEATGLDAMVGDALSFSVRLGPDGAEWSDLALSVKSGNALGVIQSDGKGGWTSAAAHAGESVIVLTYRDCNGSHSINIRVQARGSLVFKLSYDNGAVMVLPQSLGNDDTEYRWKAEYVIHAISVTYTSFTDLGTSHYRNFTENTENAKRVSDGKVQLISIAGVYDELTHSYETAIFESVGRRTETRYPYSFESAELKIYLYVDTKWYDCTYEPYAGLPNLEVTEQDITIKNK